MHENKSIGSQATGLAALLVAAIIVIFLSPSCGTELDRQFGPSSLHGNGPLPGLVITTVDGPG